MRSAVFYESWEMECCGDAFAVGDQVSWSVTPADEMTRARVGELPGGAAPAVEWLHDGHGQATEPIALAGTVRRIQAIWARSELVDASSRVYEVVLGSQIAVDLTRANRTDAEKAPADSHDDVAMLGYLVSVHSAAPRRPARVSVPRNGSGGVAVDFVP